MASVSSLSDPSSVYTPTTTTSLTPTEINSVGLYAKYALAGSIGAVPFIASKVGEGIVKMSVFATQTVRDVTHQLRGRNIICQDFEDTVVEIVEYIFRASFGIPAAIGGALLFGGAVAFSKTQALVWGQDLIEHPQEERVYTKLARYGAGDKPLEEYKLLLVAFFLPAIDLIADLIERALDSGPNETSWFDQVDPQISVVLEGLRKFEAT